jgi:hypothetical protein
VFRTSAPVVTGAIAIGVAVALAVVLERVASGVDRPPVIARIDAQAGDITATTSVRMTIVARATPAPTEARTSEATGVPPTEVVVASPISMPRPASTPAPAASAASPVAVTTAAPDANHAPILQEGTTIHGLGADPIRLIASGSEPDGEPVTFAWDFGDCLRGQNPTQFEAEVSLVRECDYAVATLTWTDPEGASARAQWTINR